MTPALHGVETATRAEGGAFPGNSKPSTGDDHAISAGLGATGSTGGGCDVASLHAGGPREYSGSSAPTLTFVHSGISPLDAIVTSLEGGPARAPYGREAARGPVAAAAMDAELFIVQPKDPVRAAAVTHRHRAQEKEPPPRKRPPDPRDEQSQLCDDRPCSPPPIPHPPMPATPPPSTNDPTQQRPTAPPTLHAWTLTGSVSMLIVSFIIFASAAALAGIRSLHDSPRALTTVGADLRVAVSDARPCSGCEFTTIRQPFVARPTIYVADPTSFDTTTALPIATAIHHALAPHTTPGLSFQSSMSAAPSRRVAQGKDPPDDAQTHDRAAAADHGHLSAVVPASHSRATIAIGTSPFFHSPRSPSCTFDRFGSSVSCDGHTDAIEPTVIVRQRVRGTTR